MELMEHMQPFIIISNAPQLMQQQLHMVTYMWSKFARIDNRAIGMSKNPGGRRYTRAQNLNLSVLS